MQTINVRRERQLEAKGERARSCWISRVSRLHSRRRLPALDGLRSGAHALLAQGNNSAADMRGQLVGLRFTPSFG